MRTWIIFIVDLAVHVLMASVRELQGPRSPVGAVQQPSGRAAVQRDAGHCASHPRTYTVPRRVAN